MEIIEEIFDMLFLSLWFLIVPLEACRICSMTFKSFTRSITIKNKRLAAILIAYKNTWGIATSREKRNKMSLLGVFSYIVLIPQIICLTCDWYACFVTGEATDKAVRSYGSITPLYYVIAVIIKLKESEKFNKGEIW